LTSNLKEDNKNHIIIRLQHDGVYGSRASRTLPIMVYTAVFSIIALNHRHL